MRSYTKIVQNPNGEIFTATFAKRFGVDGIVKRWQHGRSQSALALYNFLVTCPFIYGFDQNPDSLKWNDPTQGQTAYTGTYSGQQVTQVLSASGPAIAALGYDILDYSTHPLN